MTKKKHKSVSEKVKRLSFPEDEKKHSWLRLLLEGYYIVDKGVAKALDAEQKKGRIPACAKGCAHCCSTHQDIPIYPLEIAGVSWYAAEKLSGPDREALKTQLARYRTNDTCPFLVDAACAIHPIRPMACRQFNVFGSPCREGEDPYYSRRQDVMEPVKKHVDQAFFIMLPFYGVEKESERIKIVETGSFHQMVKELHVCNWKELAERMARRDRNNR